MSKDKIILNFMTLTEEQETKGLTSSESRALYYCINLIVANPASILALFIFPRNPMTSFITVLQTYCVSLS
jgi:hypothetical protein